MIYNFNKQCLWLIDLYYINNLTASTSFHDDCLANPNMLNNRGARNDTEKQVESHVKY